MLISKSWYNESLLEETMIIVVKAHMVQGRCLYNRKHTITMLMQNVATIGTHVNTK